MQTSSALLVFEAVLLGGPSTAAFVYGFPVMFALALGLSFQSPSSGALGLLQVCGCVWALVEYWRLSVSTFSGRLHTFGIRFWVGLAGAFAGAAGFVGSIPLSALAIFIVAPALVTLHFASIQLRRRISGHRRDA